MAEKAFSSSVVTDALNHFENGVNSGVDPDLLPKTQLAFAINATVRDTMVHPRPAFRLISLDIEMPSNMRWQGACYYNPDQSITPVPESLVAAMNGRLWQFTPSAGATATVVERTIPGDPNPAANTQAWLWQSEKWVIWNDGISNPVFFDGTTSVRSNFNVPINYASTVTTAFLVPALGSATAATNIIPVLPPLAPGDGAAASLVDGDVITIQGFGQWVVQVATAGAQIVVNQSSFPPGRTVQVGAAISWTHIGSQLPPGRMGAYGVGRNWVCLVDGKQFVASDLVGGSSGTVALNYRNAVLNITENTYLASGGRFTVPGSIGDIRAMLFAVTLDQALGQGPLHIFTPQRAFSVNAPVDRETWQALQNPILTQSLLSNGALGQNSTVNANSDPIFRSVDGVRSLILARRDFDVWGNVPISREMDRVYATDQVNLLPFGSATVFNNRHLMTTAPRVDDTIGVYHLGLVALNFDPVSTLRGKGPSVYDGLWTGLNILQIVTGMFSGVERTFAFVANTLTRRVELWELQKDADAFYDNGTIPITWHFESASLDCGDKELGARRFKRILDGEIYVDQLVGRVDFQAFYRPDQYPCWVPWHSWTECATTTGTLQFRPRMGLGEPSALDCDTSTNRPLRECYDFQFKLVVSGYCRFRGAKFKAITIPEPTFAAPICSPVCT